MIICATFITGSAVKTLGGFSGHWRDSHHTYQACSKSHVNISIGVTAKHSSSDLSVAVPPRQ